MASYANDPRWINARYAGKDLHGTPFTPGTRVLWYPKSKKILAGEVAEQAWRDFEAAKFDEAVYRGDFL